MIERDKWLDDRSSMGFSLRPMRKEDIPEVAWIERECFPTGWTPTQFDRELTNGKMAFLVVCKTRIHDVPDESGEHRTISRGWQKPRSISDWVAAFLRGGLFRPNTQLVKPAVQNIVGYVGLWFIADEAHITAIGVLDEYRRRGIGELLTLSGVELASARKARVLSLEVRVSNDGAQSLYRKYDFRPRGLRKGYYTDNSEDALIMTTTSIDSGAYQTLLSDRRSQHAKRWGDSVRLLT